MLDLENFQEDVVTINITLEKEEGKIAAYSSSFTIGEILYKNDYLHSYSDFSTLMC